MSAQPVPVARYDYRDAGGNVIATKVRLEPGWQGRRKDFVWERPLTPEQMERANHGGDRGYAGGAGAMAAGWFAPTGTRVEGAWSFAADGERKHPNAVELPRVELGLFRLPELLAAPLESPVFVVEGEKDVMTLVALGFVATCPPHGKSVWNEPWADLFAGRRVVVIPDNDNRGGIMHAKSIVGTIVCAGAAAVRFLMPGLYGYKPPGDGGDVTDWLKTIPANRQRQALADVCAATPAYRSTITQTQAA